MKTNLYNSITQVEGGKEEEITNILEKIKNGDWQDLCLKITTEKNEDVKRKLKTKVPYFTPSGTFSRRKNDCLINHSTLICIDIDDIEEDLNQIKDILSKDDYVYSCFKSISHTGLAVLIKIDPLKHKEAFEGIQSYLWENYKLIIDIACKDVSRPRFVSYDPQLYLNEKSKVFKKYLKPESKKEYAQRVNFNGYIHNNDRFEKLINSLDRDILGNGTYRDFLNIAFAIGSEYKEAGEAYFHKICSFNKNYDYKSCSKKYKYCLKPGGIKIGTFYWYCKQAGIELVSQREKQLTKLAYYAKTGGRDKESVKNLLDKQGEIITKEEEKLIQEVLESDNFKPEEDKEESLTKKVKEWINLNYEIKLNELTSEYEVNGESADDFIINNIVVNAKLALGDEVSKHLIEILIFNNQNIKYNPAKDLIESIKWDGKSRIKELTEYIKSNTGTLEFRTQMLGMWYLGIIQSIYTDIPNELCLVLAGLKNAGKTTFLRNLLPPELHKYIAFVRLKETAGKDYEILMCKKILIIDDEYNVSTKTDASLLKEYLAKDYFTYREPYGRLPVRKKRIATMCGSCNPVQVLNDPTGNRRVIPFEIIEDFDLQGYHRLDKYQLLAEFKSIFDKGFRNFLSKEQIQKLNEYTDGKNSIASIERESLMSFFYPPDRSNEYDFKTATQIKDHIETNSKQKLNINKLGQELKGMGFERKWDKDSRAYGYQIKKREINY